MKKKVLPGIYSDLSNEDYHGSEGLSSSDLKKLKRSGAHYLAYTQEEQEQSSEMRLGSLVHILLLQPDLEKDLIHVGTYNTRRGKDFEAAVREGVGKLVCNQEEIDKARSIVGSFRQAAIDHPYLNGEKYELLKGLKEHSFYWECSKTGVLLKCRPDNITPDGVIVDIKTSYDSSLEEFQRSIVNFGYYLSGAHYIEGVRQTIAKHPHPEIKVPPKAFVMIVIETKPPYAFQIYFFAPQALEVGLAHAHQAIETFKKCSETGVWESYKKEMVEINLPNWALYKFGLKGGSNE